MSEAVSRVRTPSQSRAIRTRQALVEAGEREFSERGFAATTAKTITARAGVATGSFYQYFVSKEALLLEIAAQRLAQIGTASLGLLEAGATIGDAPDLLADMRARMRQMVGLVMAYHAADPGLHAVVTERRHADRDLDALISGGERQLVERIAALLSRWGHRGDCTARAFVLFGAVEGSVHTHVLGSPIVSDERFVDALVDALIRIAMPEHLAVRVIAADRS
jgi:AcrR family transcriptional regulator